MLAFGGSRTYHRVVCNIEDAGFEIRDQLMWIYGSGFPKSLNIGEGLGTALKPAHEPIVLARKPLIGTVEQNYSVYGTGCLNIDKCRIGIEGGTAKKDPPKKDSDNVYGNGLNGGGGKGREIDAGRWPANLIHDGSEEVVAHFPEAKGQQNQLTGNEPTANGFSGAVKFGGMKKRVSFPPPRKDSGSAARFFYCAKASKTDRNEGLDHLPEKIIDHSANDRCGNCHPTVKPTNLMRYLCRLITPPGGTVLDPFAGSGSTGKGAMLEGYKVVLIEQNSEYIPIIEGRCRHANEIFLKSII